MDVHVVLGLFESICSIDEYVFACGKVCFVRFCVVEVCVLRRVFFIQHGLFFFLPRTLRGTTYGHLPRPAEEISEFKLIKLRLWIDLGDIIWICGLRPQIHIITPKSIHNLNLVNLNSLICSSKHKCNTSKTNHRHVRKELVTSKHG